MKRAAGYLDALRAFPGLQHCSNVQLAEIAKLVDVVDLPAGASVHATDREFVVTAEPVRVLVVARRATRRVHDLAPAVVPACPDAPPCDHPARDRARPGRVQRRRRRG